MLDITELVRLDDGFPVIGEMPKCSDTRVRVNGGWFYPHTMRSSITSMNNISKLKPTGYIY